MVDGVIDHNWIGSFYLNMGIKSNITDFLSVFGSIEARVGYDTKPLNQLLDRRHFLIAKYLLGYSECGRNIYLGKF